MKFRNTKTGVIIDVSSDISGGDWVPATSAPKPVVTPVPEPVSTPVSEHATTAAVEIDGITVKQIKQELDAMGIAYPATAKKQELYDLMMRK